MIACRNRPGVFCCCTRVPLPRESAVKMAATAFVLLLSSFPLAAQSQSSTSSLTNAILPSNATFAGGCPVSMDARQGVWDHTIRVQNGQSQKPREGFGQRISLTLVDIHSARIVDATVKVLGLSRRNRIVNSSASPNGSPDASRIVHLTSFSEAKSGATAELYAAGFTSVTSIQLLAVSYADGSTWTAPHSKLCHVTPDPLMLIAAH